MAETFHLDDLVKPVTRAEVQASIYAALGRLGVNTTSWKPGAVIRSMIVACSIVLASLSELQAMIARSGFLDFSDGDWLTLVARYVYGVERIAATFAEGEVTLINSAGGVYTFDPDDLILLNSATGVTFRNTATVTLGALSQATVAIRATEEGSAGSSNAGEIDTMVTVLLGVACSNEGQIVATDAETDAALRDRCRQMLGSLSPFGPWDAYTYAVRSATFPDGTSIGVNRVRIVKDGYGTVTTFVAGASGEIQGAVDDLTTPLGIADDAIQRKAAPLAVLALTESAINIVIPVAAEVWLYNTSSLSDEELQLAIDDAVTAFFAAQPIGGNVIGSNPGMVFVDGVHNAIYEALPEIFRVVVTAPAADVQLTANEVPIKGQVDIIAHREPPPEGFGGSL